MTEDLLDENRSNGPTHSDVMELGLKLSMLIESGICSREEPVLFEVTRETFKRLSSLLFSVDRLVSNRDIGVSMRSEVSKASRDVLRVLAVWEAEALNLAQPYPAHALYEVAQALGPFVQVLRTACEKWPELMNEAHTIEFDVSRIVDAFDSRSIESSRLRWQMKTLQIAHDKKMMDLDRVTKEYREETARATDIAKSLSVGDRLYKDLNEKKSKDVLVGEFRAFRNGHRWGYGFFLGGALLLMTVGATLAVALSLDALKSSSDDDFNYPDLIWRITLVTGVLGIATYMARQAGQHRTLATWASSICVQLQTFDAYTERIVDSEQINLLRAEFAKRVFGSQPQLKGEPDQAAGAMDLIPLIAAITKAAKPDGAKSP